MERTLTNLKDSGKIADVMMEIFKEIRHPIFQGISALNRAMLKRKVGRCTIHFTAESSNTELLFSHDSLSKSAQYSRSSGELVWRIGSTDSWSITPDHGQIGREEKLPFISKAGAARSGFFGTDTREE